MIRNASIAAILLLAPVAAGTQPAVPASTARTADEAAVSAVVQRMEDAWNAHDMRAYAGVFHKDATFITFQGEHLQGRQAIETTLAKAHAVAFRNSVSERRVEKISFVGPDAAVALVYRTNVITPGTPPVPSRNTLVLTRRDGAWLVHTFQNTRLAQPAAQ